MRKRLIDMYTDLKESGSTADFPNILANTMYKVLIEKFKGVASPWRQYTIQGDLADFKTADRVLVSESPDLLEIEPEGQYTDSSLKDYKYQIALKTYGRTFTIGRNTIINDDLNALKAQPARFGRAAARTIAKKVSGVLESDSLTYDGTRLFQDGRNKGVTALTNDATGIAALSAAMTAISKATFQTSEGTEKMGITAKYLLVCPDLEDVALRIVNGQQNWPVSTSGGTPNIGQVSRLTVIMEPFLSSTTFWAVLADPQEAPAIEVGFLDGKETPDLLVKRADAVSVAGGDDPWGYDFDDISYKVRHDWAIATAMWQGIYKGKG